MSNVYSLNVVGYVNVPVASGYNLLANPLKAGVTNGANEIMAPVDGAAFLTWNGAGYNYNGVDLGVAGGWINENGDPAPPPQLPPGKAFFFYNPGAAGTITFVGEVVPSPGTTNSLALPPGYSLIGTPLPVTATLGGSLDSGATVVPGALNMPVIDGEAMLPWTGAGYNYQGYDSGVPGWINENGDAISAPTITAGKGFFFYNPGAATTWKQTLP